ncbi:MAG: hypothetical protein IJC26_03690, partial [Clostridia bacterium]|nr:hypothetical protein [Clostridia bacterium]
MNNIRSDLAVEICQNLSGNDSALQGIECKKQSCGCLELETVSITSPEGALVGQNLGAKRPDLSKLYGKTGQRIAFIASTILFVLFIVLR